MATALSVGVLGPRSCGASSLARRSGPATLSGNLNYLAVRLIAPVLGVVLGAGIHQLLQRYGGALEAPAHRLCPTATERVLS
ncbi:hypothetical protein ACFVX6_19735 [Streptomyces sp. NPDC058289]|uniref:hypothetical protein n=1 Tax=Streptomyces sp. NPDC058289 TaxID=3346425 RepID=UPI0036EF2F4A